MHRTHAIKHIRAFSINSYCVVFILSPESRAKTITTALAFKKKQKIIIMLKSSGLLLLL